MASNRSDTVLFVAELVLVLAAIGAQIIGKRSTETDRLLPPVLPTGPKQGGINHFQEGRISDRAKTRWKLIHGGGGD